MQEGGDPSMNRTTYQVVMSTDGKHQVIVTIEDPAGTKAALAWARATYAQLIKAEDLAEQPGDESQEQEPPECAIHQVPMVLVQGRRGPFWSCHQKNEDGSWCNYRPKGR